MGMLKEKVIKEMETSARYYARLYSFASLIEEALDKASVELRDEVYVTMWLPADLIVACMTDSSKRDRGYHLALRRALNIPKMERRFNESTGTFSMIGESATLKHEGVPVRLILNLGTLPECKLEKVVETKEVVRYVAHCREEEEITESLVETR